MKKLSVLMAIILLGLVHKGSSQDIVQNRIKSSEVKKDRIGNPMPDLQFETLIDGQKSNLVTKEDLKGKAVILEFWTTWCAPCIKQFPKINKLVETYKDDLVIISITPETKDIADRVLNKRELSSWKGMDTDRSVVDAFGVTAYPTTVAINPEGVVVDYIHPNDLNPTYIDHLIQGNALPQKESADGIPLKEMMQMVDLSDSKNMVVIDKNPEEEKESEPIDSKKTKPTYAINITEVPPNTMESTMISKAGGFISATGLTLRKALAIAADVPETQIVGPDSLMNKKFQINAKLPAGNPKLVSDMLVQGLQNELDFSFVREMQMVDLYELTAPNGASTKSFYPSDGKNGKFSMDDGVMAAANRPIGSMTRNLSEILGTTVVDKTNLNSKYNFNLYWDHKNPKSVLKALKEQLGIHSKLVKERKEVLKIVPNTNNSISLNR